MIDAQLFNNLQNPQDPSYQYGTAGFDRRNIAVVNFAYTLPIFQHSGRLAKAVAGGWTLSGIVLMQSGNPLQINAGNNTLGLSGSTTNRADQVKAVTYPHTVNQWFDPTAFAQPAPLTWGNSPKAAVVGPGRDNWTMSLFKDFRMTERAGVQLKVDAFNVWNHTQFTGVNTGVLNGTLGTGSNAYNSTAGAINAVADPRVFQLGAKAYF